MQCGGRFLLADEMGLGKTIQALALVSHFPNNFPALVICPSSVRGVWREEAAKWLPPSLIVDFHAEVQVVQDGKEELKPGCKLYIMSYDLFTQHQDRWQMAPDKKAWQIIVCDEAHYLKSPDSKRTQALTPLLKAARRCVLLTGTPVLSNAAELFSLLDSLLPGRMPPYQAFCQRYCQEKVIYVGHGRREVRRWVGCLRSQELHTFLTSTVMLRRLKCDVLEQLPGKRRQRVALQLEPTATRMPWPVPGILARSMLML